MIVTYTMSSNVAVGAYLKYRLLHQKLTVYHGTFITVNTVRMATFVNVLNTAGLMDVALDRQLSH